MKVSAVFIAAHTKPGHEIDFFSLTLQMGKQCINIYYFECDHPLSSQHFLSATCQQRCYDDLFHEQVCCTTSNGHFPHIRINLSGI